MQFYTRYGDAAVSNSKINTRIRYGNLVHVGRLQAATMHLKLWPNRCW